MSEPPWLDCAMLRRQLGPKPCSNGCPPCNTQSAHTPLLCPTHLDFQQRGQRVCQPSHRRQHRGLHQLLRFHLVNPRGHTQWYYSAALLNKYAAASGAPAHPLTGATTEPDSHPRSLQPGPCLPAEKLITPESLRGHKAARGWPAAPAAAPESAAGCAQLHPPQAPLQPPLGQPGRRSRCLHCCRPLRLLVGLH